MTKVRILPPALDAVEITEDNLVEIRSKVRVIGDPGNELPPNLAGEPIAPGDFAVATRDDDDAFIVYPASHIEVVT